MPRRRALRRWLDASACALALALPLATGGGQPAAAQDTAKYLLGPQDRVRLKVFEWRASRDELFSWAALNDEFTIGADGTLSIPFVGEVPAAGLPTREIGRAIGQRLRERMGLAVEPDTSVEVVAYRPFYIDGYVDKPGEYPFRPGLTTAMALALAGGPPRLNGAEGYRLEREAINGRGDIMLLMQEREQLTVRMARLQAEIDGAAQMTVGPELAARPEPSIRQLIGREVSIFNARLNAFNTQIAAIDDLKRFLVLQVDTLTRQVATTDTQMKLMDTELKGLAPLVERGLATAPRQLALERAMAQIEGDKLRVSTELLRTREAISRADISILEQRNKRRTDATVESHETRAQIERLHERIVTAERLLVESQVSAPRFLTERAQARRAPATVHITRPGAQGSSEAIYASDTTPVLPGDTLKVDAPAYDFQPATPVGDAGPQANAGPVADAGGVTLR